MNWKQLVLIAFLAFCGNLIYAQEKITPVDTFQNENFVDIIENSLLEYYKEQVADITTDSIIAFLGYEEKDVPQFSDSVYCARLGEMNEMSPFHLDCNEHVLQTIDYFTRKRRKFTSITLGRSALYFSMFEEKLAKHNLPLELKYLSVIESGLRPQVKSRAGALGLWQFMYRTGKMYGLEQNSYYDERMDPEKATEAACLYLKKLHSMYDDWNMALAAYNAGPGNVNKAIRRSGGKMTYWEIRPYLPRETQGYVPNFIAMSYMMTYYASHNIYPLPPAIHDFEIDTICIKRGLNMKSIDTVINWSVEDIQHINPIYKTTYIPKTDPPQCISIPITFVKDWLAMEDSIYKTDSILFYLPSDEDLDDLKGTKHIFEGDKLTHTVRSGESLSVIASNYGTTVSNLMDWNSLYSTRLKVGQKLTIYGKNAPKPKKPTKKVETSSSSISNNTKDLSADQIYVIKSGDNLWEIAKKKNTTVTKLQDLNPEVNYKDLKVGQKIRIK